MKTTLIIISIIVLMALMAWGIIGVARCIRNILFIRRAKKTGNPIYQKQGLVMKWTDYNEASVEADYTIITPGR